MRQVVPIANLSANYMPEMGRLRLGIKDPSRGRNGRGGMRSLSTWRFTSPDRAAIGRLADIYGGTPGPWSDPKANPKNQFEVITEANRIRIWLPPEALSQWYEQWGGGGCVRRCDGESVEVFNGEEPVSVPCLCTSQNNMVCRPYTRLRFVIPEVEFGGVWRMETKGWNAAKEMPTMERMLQELASHGLLEAVLALEAATAEGGKKEFVVPRLKLAYSALELAQGAAQVAIGSAAAPAAAAGELGPAPARPGPAPAPSLESEDQADDVDPYDESDVIDAEIIETDEVTLPPTPADRMESTAKRKTRLLLLCDEVWEGRPWMRERNVDASDLRHAFCHRASKGRTPSHMALEPEEVEATIDVLVKVRNGLVDIKDVRLVDDGWLLELVKL